HRGRPLPRRADRQFRADRDRLQPAGIGKTHHQRAQSAGLHAPRGHDGNLRFLHRDREPAHRPDLRPDRSAGEAPMSAIATVPERGAWARLGTNMRRHKMASLGAGLVVAVALSAIFAPWLSPHDPLEQDVLLRLAGPSADFPLGNDDFGRDILSRILWGGRVSLLVGTSAALFSIVVVGAVASVAGDSERDL